MIMELTMDVLLIHIRRWSWSERENLGTKHALPGCLAVLFSIYKALITAGKMIMTRNMAVNFFWTLEALEGLFVVVGAGPEVVGLALPAGWVTEGAPLTMAVLVSVAVNGTVALATEVVSMMGLMVISDMLKELDG
ncbi:MAG: hypothetical protein J3Q66DRAFT_349900 [Benniella sp.]|nr:MAG: hypothetical protein J3Q66DRAFT_349900 [Benniella sp.]